MIPNMSRLKLHVTVGMDAEPPQPPQPQVNQWRKLKRRNTAAEDAERDRLIRAKGRNRSHSDTDAIKIQNDLHYKEVHEYMLEFVPMFNRPGMDIAERKKIFEELTDKVRAWVTDSYNETFITDTLHDSIVFTQAFTDMFQEIKGYGQTFNSASGNAFLKILHPLGKVKCTEGSRSDIVMELKRQTSMEEQRLDNEELAHHDASKRDEDARQEAGSSSNAPLPQEDNEELAHYDASKRDEDARQEAGSSSNAPLPQEEDGESDYSTDKEEAREGTKRPDYSTLRTVKGPLPSAPAAAEEALSDEEGSLGSNPLPINPEEYGV